MWKQYVWQHETGHYDDKIMFQLSSTMLKWQIHDVMPERFLGAWCEDSVHAVHRPSWYNPYMNAAIETLREGGGLDSGTEELRWGDDVNHSYRSNTTCGMMQGEEGRQTEELEQSRRAESWCPLPISDKNHQLRTLCEAAVMVISQNIALMGF